MSKFTFFVLCVVAVSLSKVYASDEDKAKLHEALKPLVEECMKDHEVSLDDLKAAKEAKSADGVKPCFLACVYKKAEVLNDKGEFDADHALEKLKEFVSDEDVLAKVAEVGNTCKAVNDKAVSDGDAGCERAALLTACFLEHKAEILV
uniref:OBP1 n=1 Tax=Helicoverpa armigera TaxID=29058 RepID=F5ANH4_HELAM|nr:OBP1 [Helicoverpa armigera]